MSRDHAETLRLKDTLLEDFAGQLAEAERELQRRAAALTDAERRATRRRTRRRRWRPRRETIAVQEGAISRLEAKVEEIDEQRGGGGGGGGGTQPSTRRGCFRSSRRR